MKKVLLSIVMAVFAVMACFGLVACGEESFVGEYETESIVIEGTTYNVGEKIPEKLVTDNVYTVRNDDMLVIIGKQTKKSIKSGSFVYQRYFGGGLDNGGGYWDAYDDGSVKFSFSPKGSYELELTEDGKLVFTREWRFKTDNDYHNISFILKKVK